MDLDVDILFELWITFAKAFPLLKQIRFCCAALKSKEIDSKGVFLL